MAAYDKGLSMITMLYFHECIFSRCISMLDITPTQINDTPRVPSGIEIGLDIYTTWYIPSESFSVDNHVNHA